MARLMVSSIGNLVLSSERLMRVDDVMKKCVAFVATLNTVGDGYALRGTAFFYSIEEQNESYSYIVTARHNVDRAINSSRDGQLYLRMNLKNGGIEHIPTKHSDWLFHDDNSVDVAVLPLDGFTGFNQIVECKFVTDKITCQQSDRLISIGDEAIIVGLFKQHAGKGRNIPIVRMAHVAAMPEEKVEAQAMDIDAYLLEVRSIGGLSGSPVFWCMSPTLSDEPVTDQYIRRKERYAFLLMGIVHGHWKLSKAQQDAYIADGEDQQQSVNAGIAMVVPIDKLTEALNQPELIEKRRRYDKERRARNGAVED